MPLRHCFERRGSVCTAIQSAALFRSARTPASGALLSCVRYGMTDLYVPGKPNSFRRAPPQAVRASAH
jgi:hypothetical protein